MAKLKTKYLVSFLGLAISGFMIFYLFKKIDSQLVWETLKGISTTNIILLIAVYLSSFLIRSFRWQLMVHNQTGSKFFLTLRSILVGFSGNNVLPARGGEILRMEYFSRNSDLNRTSSLTYILLEKILDALTLLLFLLLTVRFISVRDDFIRLSELSGLLIFIFIPTGLLLVVLRLYGNTIVMSLKKSSSGLIIRLAEILNDIILSIHFLKIDVKTLMVVLSSLVIWTIEMAVFYLGFQAMGLPGPLIVMSSLTLCIVNFSILIPSSPGYLGVFQASVIASLLIFNVSKETGLGASILIHSVQLIPVTVIGLSIVIKESFKIKSK